MKLTEIRKKFLDYFASKGHKVLPSSSLVPIGDATLLFTNAGMNQFKDNFLGVNQDLKRAATSQKCVRAGGKHNDLENVGFTTRHHTFFEMLGNFSFGDYFKTDAIDYAWELLTRELKIDPSRLYVTVHTSDDEAEKLWTKWIAKERIFRCGDKDNFWQMGDTGPCGPCSEIFYSRVPSNYRNVDEFYAAQEKEECMEIWNLVFMQFDRDAGGKLSPLPKPCVDTGAGLERVASVLQGVDSNFHIDFFIDFISAIEALTGLKYGRGNSETDVSMRVVADHARACSFLIADGVLPSNEGRGYVLRRILRRAIRHGKRLGMNDPFIFKLYPKLIELMGKAYPELEQRRDLVVNTLSFEEANFHRTLHRGLELLNAEIEKVKRAGQKQISGDQIFLLYDSYGFPVDLTETILQEHALGVDHAGFEKAMDKQREQSKKNWKGSGDKGSDAVVQEAYTKGLRTEFVGYGQTEATATLTGLWVKGQNVATVTADVDNFPVRAFFKQSPFYGESGGQSGDRGEVLNSSGAQLGVVSDAQKPFKDLVDHHVLLSKGQSLQVGSNYGLRVNAQQREATAKNHTATHLLHAALRKVLGTHVMQAGSLVESNRLRFDFNHFAPIKDEELKRIEELINAEIARASPVTTDEMDFEEATGKGVMALFGEKYDKIVRVIQVGDFSAELCGGTHVTKSSDIGSFVVRSEEGIASGVRRIEALTGLGAVEYLRKRSDELMRLEKLLKTPAEKIFDRVADLNTKIDDQNQELKNLKQKVVQGFKAELGARAESIGTHRALICEIPSDPAFDTNSVREMAKDLNAKGVGAVVLGQKLNGKALIFVAMDAARAKQMGAGDLIKKLAPTIAGQGGGKPDFAQCGGTNVEALGAALKLAREILAGT